MNHLYFIRHGLSVMNEQGLLAGSTDTPLSATGREQARTAGRVAQKLNIDLIVASPLSRAKSTATIIAEEIGYSTERILFDDRAVERDFGNMEGTEWHPGISFNHNNSVESYDAIMQRAEDFKNWLDERPEDTILVVSHGAFLRALRSLYLPDMPYQNTTATMANAEIMTIV
jgi:broad specificity phosphatase PhoE